MALFLDSAQIAAAEYAQSVDFIEGITTNPAFMVASGRAGLDVLKDLTQIFDGHVFYQLTATSLEARLDEAWQAYDVRPDRVVINIPTTIENLGLVSKLSGVDLAMTAIFSPAQAYLAAEVGVDYVIPYVHHASQTLGDGIGLVRDIAALVEGSGTQILAANLHSVDEAIAALKAGAHHITLPLNLLKDMGNHPLTQQMLEGYPT